MTKLRLGLLIDSYQQPRWIYSILDQIKKGEFAEIVLVVKKQSSSPSGFRDGLRKLFHKRSLILWKLYEMLDRWIFTSDSDPFELIDIAPLLADFPTLPIHPIERGFCDYFSDSDITQIKAYGLDVAWRINFRILQGDILQIAKYGVWSYHHGDNLRYRGGPAGVWEVIQKVPTTGSVLQILSEKLDHGTIIYRGWFPTNWYSVKRNRDNLYWKTSAYIIQRLKDLSMQGSTVLHEDTYQQHYHPYCYPLYRTPSNLEMVYFLLDLARRLIKRAFEKLCYLEQWCLGYRLQSSPGLTDVFYNFRWMIPPRDRYWADPFPVHLSDRYYIFIEEFMLTTQKGHISVIELGSDGTWKRPQKVLERPYHLSYPYIFQHQDTYYMVPETSAHKTIELYRCKTFPYEWELEKTLMDNVCATDATLFHHENQWWMFVNIKGKGMSTSDELYLFYAQYLHGPWNPHLQNPIKMDVRSARPAGRPFLWKNALYRPAQDSSRCYGHAVTLNHVTRITPNEFIEEEASQLTPQWKRSILRTHTLNYVDSLTCIDGFMQRWRFFIPRSEQDQNRSS